MHYQDFEVRIRSDRLGGFITEVRSPYGTAGEPFAPPFPPGSIEKLLSRLELRSGGMRHLATDEDSTPGPELTQEEIGQALFTALFSGKVTERLKECLASLDSHRDVEGLRVLLHVDPDDRDVTPIAALPWELLYNPDRRDFLSRLLHTPVVRYLSVPGPPPTPSAERLRILVVQAGPSGLDPLDLTQEWQRIWGALRSRPHVEVAPCLASTLEELHRRLRTETWHVVHFMGHGDFEASGQGSLAFEDLDHSEHRVSGMLLGEHLKSCPHLRLVVLNACNTGALARRGGQDPYGSVASALLLAGVPSVLAMQFSVSDQAAIAFSAELYAQLAERVPLEAALAEARLALLRLDETSIEWATPVLFTRVPSHALTELSVASPSSAAVVAWRETPLRLGIRSFSDSKSGFLWDQEIVMRCDTILDLRHCFGGPDGRNIKDPAWWESQIIPDLRTFLAAAITERRPLSLSFAAHTSIAFAAGHFLESKSCLDITIRQPNRRGGAIEDWRVRDGASAGTSAFLDEPEVSGDAASSDVAIALGASWPIREDVVTYLSPGKKLSVRRVLPATLGPDGVRDGRHALQLAQALAWTIRGRTGMEREGTLHLFAAAPNALTFFLGQLSRAFGQVQLYEHDYGAKVPSAYSPSLRFPLG